MSNLISKSVYAVKNWWIYTIAGIALVGASFWTMATPAGSYVALSIVFSVAIFINGISNTIFSIGSRDYIDGWGWILVGGIFDILFGAYLMYNPAMSMIALPVFVAIWILFRGFQVVGLSFDLKKYEVKDWGWILAFGLLLAIIGMFMLIDPAFAVANVVALAFFAFFTLGVANIVLSLKLRKLKRHTLDMADKVRSEIRSFALNIVDLLNENNLLSEEAKREETSKS